MPASLIDNHLSFQPAAEILAARDKDMPTPPGAGHALAAIAEAKAQLRSIKPRNLAPFMAQAWGLSPRGARGQNLGGRLEGQVIVDKGRRHGSVLDEANGPQHAGGDDDQERQQPDAAGFGQAQHQRAPSLGKYLAQSVCVLKELMYGTTPNSLANR